MIGSESNETHPDCRGYDQLLSEGKELGVDDVVRRQEEVQFDDPFTVVFTSGSTGQPKGVQHTHHSMVNGIRSLYSSSDTPSRTFNDRPFCWAGGLDCILSVMAIGSTTVVVPSIKSVTEKDTDLVLSVLQNDKCTGALLMPYVIADMLHHPRIGDYNLSTLKYLIIGGQAVPLATLKQLKAIIPHCTLLVFYGLSEVGSPVALRVFSPSPVIEDDSLLTFAMEILPPMEVKIMDEANKLVRPLGTVGEIAVRSRTLFLEYMDDPEETSKIISPTGWVHTGDLGFIDDDGRIRICGRKTEVIKRATVKIYPAEIEHMLIKHPDVQSVLVVGVPDDRLYEELCACVIPKSGSSLDEKVFDEWDYLKRSVDEQGLSMKPRYTIVMEEFPTTNTGKFDRKKLREMAIKKLVIRTEEA